MNTTAAGVLLGLGLGLGVAMIGGALLHSRRPSLDSRVLPYVRDVPLVSVRWNRPPSDRASSAGIALIRPLLDRGAQRLESLIGGHETVRRRLERAGETITVHEFRLSQVGWGLFAAGSIIVIGLLGPGRDPAHALTWLLMAAAAGLLGIMLRDWVLTRAARRREQQMLAEFPAVADLLALAVAAGEGPVGAIGRVVATCRGALADEMARVLAESRSGTPITTALDELARRTDLSIVARFAEGVVVAIERGTPLVDVLAAQAVDVREASRRALIESGARKEVAMMVPVVFLIMPVTLLFAFFPGVVGLRFLTP